MSIPALQFYKCLADKTRLQLLLLIEQEQELCVCELVEALAESQPKISRHLAQLRQCGLLQTRRNGQWVFYSIHPTLPKWAKDTLSISTQSNTDYISCAVDRLKAMGNRPKRQSICC